MELETDVSVQFADDADGENHGGDSEDIFGRGQRVVRDRSKHDGRAEQQTEAVKWCAAHAADHLVKFAQSERADQHREDDSPTRTVEIYAGKNNEPEENSAENTFTHGDIK